MKQNQMIWPIIIYEYQWWHYHNGMDLIFSQGPDPSIFLTFALFMRACVFHKIVTVCLISLNCLITYNPFFYFVEYMQKNKHWKSFFTLFFWHHFLKEVHIFFIRWLIFVVTYGRLGFLTEKSSSKFRSPESKFFSPYCTLLKI